MGSATPDFYMFADVLFLSIDALFVFQSVVLIINQISVYLVTTEMTATVRTD